MRILVVYGSALGATRGIAERVAATIGSDGHDVDVRSAAESPPVEGYDALVIGSAVHGGHWLPEAAAFVRTNRERLADRPTWLFSSGPVGDQYVTREGPDPAEIEDFRSWITPRDHRVFAGAHDRSSTLADRLGTVNRFVARRLIPEGDWRDWPAIEAWA
ncbi:MAG TPA: flavodoxin domain-containing protein, partial [Candidatus Limnocylindrales bacterium]|nr:flavodoxin domain-containing protein [Candidatus Limnocylindrales bacterium]